MAALGPPSFVTQERWATMTPAEKRATRPRAPDLDVSWSRFDPSDTDGRGFPEQFLRETLGLSKGQWNAMTRDEHERAVAQVLAVLQPPYPDYMRPIMFPEGDWPDMSERRRERQALTRIQSIRSNRTERRSGDVPRPSFVARGRWEAMTRYDREATRPRAPDNLSDEFVVRTLGMTDEQWNDATPDEHDRFIARVVAVLRPPYPEWFTAILRSLGVSEFRWGDLPDSERERLVYNRRVLNRPAGFDYTALWKNS